MPLQPLHPYETAKAAQDFAAQSYGKIFNLPVAITRCGNYFGGYDFNFTRLIPGVVQSIMQGEAPTLRSNEQFTRDFLYIEDGVDVQLLLAQKLSADANLSGEAWISSAAGNEPSFEAVPVRIRPAEIHLWPNRFHPPSPITGSWGMR